MNWFCLLKTLGPVLVGMVCARGKASEFLTEEEVIARVRGLVPSFRPVDLPAGSGVVVVAVGDGYCIEDLRGKPLDPDPPVFQTNPPTYKREQSVGVPEDRRAYVARKIAPFRLRFFNVEFINGGRHNSELRDYAATHGCNLIYPYWIGAELTNWMPTGTRYVAVSYEPPWEKAIPDYEHHHGVHFHRIAIQSTRHDFVARGRAAGFFQRPPWQSTLMIDIEHPVLMPQELRSHRIYPRDASAEERAEFEARYYEGYALHYALPVQVARCQGWPEIGIYGWAPFPRTWFGIGKISVDPAKDLRWHLFGERIYEVVDVIYPDVYCFYWNPANVAYTLANIDLNRRILAHAGGKRKPMRPYYWSRLHGGGSTGWRWWQGLPMPDEDYRAMIAMAFFSGVDGVVNWDWTGLDNHHVVNLCKETVHTLARAWNAPRADGQGTVALPRYARVLIVEDSDPAAILFKEIRDNDRRALDREDNPAFVAPTEELQGVLRPRSASKVGFFEALALIKPIEEVLRNGDVKVDVPSGEQFAKVLPIVRRVRFGSLSWVATYDPAVVHGNPSREVRLTDFDDVAGRTIILPADDQLRIFALRHGQKR